MPTFSEANTVQQPVVDLLVAGGWSYVPGNQLARSHEQTFIEDDVVASLVRLNAVIAEEPARAQEVLMVLRALTLTAENEGLVEANMMFASWLRGREHHQFAGTTFHEPIRLIDFDNPENNTLVVSDEVTHGVPGTTCRFDIVLWVNGFPLAVGEVKTAVDTKVSWIKGARDIHNVYEARVATVLRPQRLLVRHRGPRVPLRRHQAGHRFVADVGIDAGRGDPGWVGACEAVRRVAALATHRP